MSLLQRFQQHITAHQLFSAKDTLLLAVSGGVDSVVLCELCKQAGYTFVIAHCNFKLRGTESERDAAFVEQLAKHYNVPFLKKKFNTEAYAAERKLSIQEAARELRYGWFAEILKSEVGSLKSEVGSKKYEAEDQHEGSGKQEPDVGDLNPSEPFHVSQPVPTSRDLPFADSTIADCRLPIAALLTAHHLDDNIETMLMHFFRGTGIHGLRGMLPKQGHIVRPLLFARKQELQQFATDNQLQWVEDSSNALDKYSRNYFRHQLIPLVQKIYPETENNLAANLRRFSEMEVLYEQAVAQHKKKLLEYRGQEVHIPVLKLQKAEPLHTLVYEIIKDYGFTSAQREEVIRLLQSESGRYVQSATHRIIKNRRWLIIASIQTGEAQTLVIDADEQKVVFDNGALVMDLLVNNNVQLNTDAAFALLDSDTLQFPLLLRKWKKGDYFYPLGLRKKKKLARFFIDQKLSLTDKEKVWVLESNKKIIWVVGLRIDDRFKLTDTTKKVLRIQLQKS